jgi:hypothetical protein
VDAERAVQALGFRELRVGHFGATGFLDLSGTTSNAPGDEV